MANEKYQLKPNAASSLASVLSERDRLVNEQSGTVTDAKLVELSEQAASSHGNGQIQIGTSWEVDEFGNRELFEFSASSVGYTKQASQLIPGSTGKFEASEVIQVSAVSGTEFDTIVTAVDLTSNRISAFDEAASSAVLSNAIAGKDSASLQESNALSSTKSLIDIRSNPLTQYASVVHRISLLTIQREAFNQLQTAGVWAPQPGDWLIAGGGGKSELRSEFFTSDFFIDDLELESIIGISGASRNTNATDMSFTITEPYGVSLVERLVRSAAATNEGNYIQQPYVLQIEFLGYDSEGQEITASDLRAQTKNIPIRITNIEFNIDTTGSVYRIQAIPFAHSAYDTQRNVIPFELSVTNSTLKGFFNSKSPVVAPPRPPNPQEEQPVQSADAYKGLADALNEHERTKVVNNLQEYPDVYAFELDEAIAEAVLAIGDLTDLEESKTPVKSSKDAESIRYSSRDGFTYDNINGTYSISQGTSITELINLMVRRSSYITSQATVQVGTDGVSVAESTDGKAINWWKIVPSIGLGEYDKKRNDYARIITYRVVAMEINGRNHDNFGRKMPENPHKHYDYMFAGTNTEITDFAIEYNALYYQAKQIIDNNSVTPTTGNGPVQTKAESVKRETTSTAPIPVVYETDVESTLLINSGRDIRTIAAGELTNELLNQSVDMIDLNLTISGDPDYINTTDYVPITNDVPSTREVYLPDGGINYNARECYIRINLRTPTDYDPTTGEMDLTKTSRSALVSGIYRVTSVSSSFVGGAFTQSLQGYKLLNPVNNIVTDNDTNNIYDTPNQSR